MKACKLPCLWYWLLLFTMVAASPRAPTAQSFWQKLLRVTGISATPSQMKADDDDPTDGEIWIAEIKNRQLRQLTPDAGFRSPVFGPDGKSILSLRSNDIYRIPLIGGMPAKVQAIPGVSKLVGFSRDDTNLLCLLVEQHGEPLVGFLSLNTGVITLVGYDKEAAKDQRMIDHIKGWEREYDGIKLYLDKQHKSGLSGEVEWTDVFLKRDRGSPINLSRGNGVNCGQPSLAPSSNEVVFIKATP